MTPFTLAWHYTPFTLPLFVATLLNLALAFVAWRRRSVAGATAFAVLVLAGAIWSVAYALQLGGLDVPTQLFFGNLEYLGIVTVPVATLVFALSYTGRSRWMKPAIIAALSFEPLLTVVLVWLMPTNGLVRAGVVLDTSGPLTTLVITRGPWFWVHTAYSYGVLAVGSGIILDAYRRSPHRYRQQAGALLIAVLTPLVANVVYLAQLSPMPHLDLTPYAFTITGIALAWALFQGRLLDLVLGFPLVAGAVIVERMPDGVILVDGNGTIVEINPVASRIVSRSPATLVGRPIRGVLPAWDSWTQPPLQSGSLQVDLRLDLGAGQRDYDVLVSSQSVGSGRLLGWILVLRDVTERRRIDEALRLARDAEVTQRVEQARLEGVLLTVRETAHRLNNALAEASGFIELALLQPDPNERTHALLREANGGIDAAISYVRSLQRVTRVATHSTPSGPSLDLDRSVDGTNAGLPDSPIAG